MISLNHNCHEKSHFVLVLKKMADTAMMGESNQEVAIILNDSNLFNGKPLRIFGTYEEPLFVASELCEFIGVKNSPQSRLRFRL